MVRGIYGGGQVEVDVNGKPVKMLGKREPVLGDSLVLTIDFKIQQAAEKAMDDRLKYQTKSGNFNAKVAAAVVMNPKTGEILVMVSRPTFNLNSFNGGISIKDWKVMVIMMILLTHYKTELLLENTHRVLLLK